MSRERKTERRKQLRKQHQADIRQQAVITDYLRYKHTHIYSEAVAFYEQLNKKHPTKRDLRKTDEYKYWKTFNTEEGQEQTSKPTYTDNLQLKNTEEGQEQTSKPIYTDNLQLKNTEEGQEQTSKPIYTDNLQLKIPLFQHKPSDTDQILQASVDEIRQTVTDHTPKEDIQIRLTVTEQIVEEGIQPSIFEDLSPEIMEKLIEDLQAEPALTDLFTTIDQVEFEQLRMNIDIPTDDNALAIEVSNW